jgi:hypothetical protein
MTYLNRTILAAFVATVVAMPAAATLTTTERQAASTAAQDIEPVVISQMRSGVEHQAAVWMELDASGNTVLKYSHHAAGTSTNGSIPQLTGFTGSYADPYLGQRESIGRIYLTAVVRVGQTNQPSRILLWRSLNGGLTWLGPVIVDQNDGSTAFLDKPTLSVSPTTGYVYVVYRRQIINSTQIMLKVSLNNGGGFDLADGLNTFFIGTAINGHTAPMVVNDDTGEVYVLWVRYAITDRISILRGSEYDPFAPSNRIDFTGSTIITRSFSDYDFYWGNAGIPVGAVTVRGATVPMVKLDPHVDRRRIVLTWHMSNGTRSAIFMMVIPIVSGADVPVTSWGAPTQIASSAGPAIQPALDFNPSNGNFLVSYYGFRASSSQYDHSAVYVSISGTTPSVIDSGFLRATPSNVANYPADPGSGQRLLGEYQDVHFRNGSFKTASIVIGTAGNPHVFTTVP